MRVGVLGGVFNPPHLGHLICACEAVDQLGLDLLRVVPARRPPHRAIEPEPGAEVRAELCERAVEGRDALAVGRDELDRGGPSYTVDTLRAMHEAAPEDELFLVLGSDQARAIGSWREPREVLSLAQLAVAEREGAATDVVEAALAPLDAAEPAWIEMPAIGISSTLVRARVGGGHAYDHLVPPGVARMIQERGLYATAAETAR